MYMHTGVVDDAVDDDWSAFPLVFEILRAGRQANGSKGYRRACVVMGRNRNLRFVRLPKDAPRT